MYIFPFTNINVTFASDWVTWTITKYLILVVRIVRFDFPRKCAHLTKKVG